ncbi:MAG: DUF418 domain-containing protein, partial [Cytophagales bacterium]|nr:DUF418 domain-containing protein [Cytophagales bacterium]
MLPAPFRPIEAHERIQLVDALRGFALLGVLVVNLWSLSRYEWLPPERQTHTWLSDGLMILIDTKFITIFSVLFGAGFWVQRQRARDRGVSFPAFYLGRVGILFLMACGHAYLFWFGDIVRHYALLGIALLTVRGLSPRATLRLAGVCIGLLTPLVFIGNGVLDLHTTPGQVDGLPLAAFVYGSFTAGSYPQILRANWLIDPLRNFAQDMPIALVSMFGKMLLGVWLAQIGFFRNPAAHAGRIRWWLWWGGLAGVPGSVAYWAIKKGLLSLESPWMLPLVFAVSACLVLHSLFYVALFVTLYNGRTGAVLLRFFAPVGRMALSNYFGQTLLAFALFYGTGRVGRVGPPELLAWAAVIFTVQLGLSRWWLRRHAFGPAEWLWRRLSYAIQKGDRRPEAGRPEEANRTLAEMR